MNMTRTPVRHGKIAGRIEAVEAAGAHVPRISSLPGLSGRYAASLARTVPVNR